MARIRFHDSNGGRWNRFDELIPAESLGEFAGPELSSTIFIHERGDAQTMQLAEVRYLPRISIKAHAHDVDEIHYVIEGELQIGSRAVRPGGSVFIARDTLYTLKTGEHGARFLTFRAVGDLSYVTEQMWNARRAGASTIPHPDASSGASSDPDHGSPRSSS